jgi:hypothetical protein
MQRKDRINEMALIVYVKDKFTHDSVGNISIEGVMEGANVGL